MATSADKRRMVRERKLRRSQSRWLQKALFALSKAEDEHAKLMELRGGDDEHVDVEVDGTSYEMDQVTAALRDSVDTWLESQQAARRSAHVAARKAAKAAAG